MCASFLFSLSLSLSLIGDSPSLSYRALLPPGTFSYLRAELFDVQREADPSLSIADSGDPVLLTRVDGVPLFQRLVGQMLPIGDTQSDQKGDETRKGRWR